MQNVLIVSEAQSYLLVSLRDRLEETGHNVITVCARVEILSELSDDIHLIFIFTDRTLLDRHQGLVYLKDKAIEREIPIFVTGDEQELEILTQDIPLRLMQRRFPRPIHVNEVAQSITSYIKLFAKRERKKVLVVDDSGAMLRNVKGWLEDSYQVILANSGAMAIKFLSTNRPDLVLLDYEMPVVDGKQVLEMIRSEPEFFDIPVIFLTSKGDRESVMQVMALKPEGYLLKTMPPEQIKQAVDDFFERKKAAAMKLEEKE